MKVHCISVLVKVLAGCMVVLVFSGRLGAERLSSLARQETAQAGYYSLLEKIPPDSVTDRLTALGDFLKSYPDFEQVYHAILDCYLVQRRIHEATSYFRGLTEQVQYRRNSLWMLAKLLALQDDPSAAFNAYSQALHAGSPTLELLKDFVDFDHEQQGTFNAVAVIDELRLNRDAQVSVSFLINHLHLNHVEAIKILDRMPRTILSQSLVLYLGGDCFYRRSQFAQADSLWRMGLVLARRTGDRRSEAQFLTNLGMLARVAGRYDETLRYYDSAYAIATRIGDPCLKQRILGNRGNISNVCGDYVAATASYQTAIAQAELVGAYGHAAVWYSNYAGVLFQLGRFDEALQAYDRSEEMAIKANKPIQRIELMIMKADLYVYLNQGDFAKSIFKEVQRFAQKNNLPEYEYRARVRLADLLVGERKYAEARNAYRGYLDFLNQPGREVGPAYCPTPSRNRSERAYWMGKIASTYELEGRHHLARSYYNRAIKAAAEVGAKTDEAWNILKAADLEVVAGRTAEAIAIYTSAMNIAEADTNMNMLSQAYFGLGNAHKKAGDLTNAIISYQRSVQIIEAARLAIQPEQLRIGFFSTKSQVYQKLANCFFQRYELTADAACLDSLFYYEQLSHSRALDDLKFDNSFQPDATQDDQEYMMTCDRLSVLQRRLRQAQEDSRPLSELTPLFSQVDAARYSLLSQRMQLVEGFSFDNKRQRPPVRSLSEALKELKETNVGLLFYHLSDDGAFVLAAAGDEAKAIRLQLKPSALVAAIDSLLTPFHTIPDREYTQQIPFRADIAFRLYQSLVAPCEAAVRLPTRLLIVPDLPLMNLPFEMLLHEPPERCEYRPADDSDYATDFLLNRYTFVYTPSVSLLQGSLTSISRKPGVLVFANPFSAEAKAGSDQRSLRLRTGWSFDPLLFSGVEATGIRNIDSKVKIYERHQATKANFVQEATKHQILHFATHAFADTVFDAFSGLVLAAGADSTDDGILMGYEIADLRLNSELVTLSACETGRGKLVAGEGVLGLPRQFLGAGAKSVLMTLWKVDDRFASELMPAFYHYFLKEKLSKAEALVQAKRSIIGKYSTSRNHFYVHPFYWASFVLFGDPGMEGDAPSSIHDFSSTLILVLLCGLMHAVYQGYVRRYPKAQPAKAVSVNWHGSDAANR